MIVDCGVAQIGKKITKFTRQTVTLLYEIVKDRTDLKTNQHAHH